MAEQICSIQVCLQATEYNAPSSTTCSSLNIILLNLQIKIELLDETNMNVTVVSTNITVLELATTTTTSTTSTTSTTTTTSTTSTTPDSATISGM